MRSPDNGHRELVVKTALLMLSVALAGLEYFLPRLPFLPWLKPGLANIITLIWIIDFGAADALLFCLMRTWITGCYFGFSFVTLSLSASGAVFATLVMGALWQAFGRKGRMGTVGISVAGAFAHNAGQLCAVYLLMTGTNVLFYQLPFMSFASVLFGGFVGAMVPPVKAFLDGRVPDAAAVFRPRPEAAPVSRRDTAGCLAALGASFGLVFINDQAMLALAAAATGTVVFAAGHRSPFILLAPFRRFWAIFLWIGLLYSIDPYGTRIDGVPFITRESARLVENQWLRMWIWIELSFVLSRLNFHTLFFAVFARVFPGRQTTLTAAVAAFEYLPLVMNAGRWKPVRLISAAARNPAAFVRRAVGTLFDAIIERLSDGNGSGFARKPARPEN